MPHRSPHQSMPESSFSIPEHVKGVHLVGDELAKARRGSSRRIAATVQGTAPIRVLDAWDAFAPGGRVMPRFSCAAIANDSERPSWAGIETRGKKVDAAHPEADR